MQFNWIESGKKNNFLNISFKNLIIHQINFLNIRSEVFLTDLFNFKYQNVLLTVKFCHRPYLSWSFSARAIKKLKNAFLVNDPVGTRD